MVKVDSITEHNRTDYQQKYPELFTGLGCIEEEYEIKKELTTEPVSVTTPKCIPFTSLATGKS